MHYNVSTNIERSRALRLFFQRLSKDELKPLIKALNIDDKLKSRDEAIERTARAMVNLLPEPSKSSEKDMNTIYETLNIPQQVCLLFTFRDRD